MTFEEIKSAVMGLSEKDQQKLIMEIVPQIWPKACRDDACVQRVRELVDEEAIRKYREQHMGHI